MKSSKMYKLKLEMLSIMERTGAGELRKCAPSYVKKIAQAFDIENPSLNPQTLIFSILDSLTDYILSDAELSQSSISTPPIILDCRATSHLCEPLKNIVQAYNKEVGIMEEEKATLNKQIEEKKIQLWNHYELSGSQEKEEPKLFDLSKEFLCYCNKKEINAENYIRCARKQCLIKMHHKCFDLKPESVVDCITCIFLKNNPMREVLKVLVPISKVVSGEEFSFEVDKKTLEQMERGNLVIDIKCGSYGLSSKVYYLQAWPDWGRIFLNKNIPIFEFKPLMKNSSLKRRRDEAFSLTKGGWLRKGKNEISFLLRDIDEAGKKVFRKHPANIGFYFTVLLSKKLSPEELIEKIGGKKTKAQQNHNIEYIKAFFNELSVDRALAADKSIVKMTDPITCGRIKYPVRGAFCKHLQCFCLENFVKLCSLTKHKKWQCPICKERAYELILDGVQTKILEEHTKKGEKLGEITFFNNGEYETRLDVFESFSSTLDMDIENVESPEIICETPFVDKPKKEEPDFFMIPQPSLIGEEQAEKNPTAIISEEMPTPQPKRVDTASKLNSRAHGFEEDPILVE